MTDDGVAATAIVVFGATGDLAGRKLFPALASLALHDQLPAGLAVVGVARTVMSDTDFGGLVEDASRRRWAARRPTASARCATSG